MPWAGGIFSRTNGVHTGATTWAQDQAAATNMLSTLHDTHDQDLAAGINFCLAKDGSNNPTANLPMNSFKHTGVAAATGSGQYMRYDEVTANYQPLNSALTAISSAGFAVPTGTMLDHLDTVAPTGFVMASGRTIGNASSSGTERANADTSALFTLLWNAYSNSICPVSSGRGANAAADFAANKTITLPDLRGRVAAGKDDMGGSAAARMTSGNGLDGTVLGNSGGEQVHTLLTAEMPSHTHTQQVSPILAICILSAMAPPVAAAALRLMGAALLLAIWRTPLLPQPVSA
jgi:hypothetical protein